MLIYIFSVAARTSMGVAGVVALERFHIDASRLAVFTSVQVGIYALSQVPCGILLDRYGSRKVLLGGASLLGLGQVVLSLTAVYPVAIGARILIGMGDACAFISVLRLLPKWFSPKLSPLMNQITSVVGMLGQVISAIPFLALLHLYGWTCGFLSLTGGMAFACLVGVLTLRDSYDCRSQAIYRGGSIRNNLRQVARERVVWLAFFMHFTGMFPLAVFTMLWGVPIVTLGAGISEAQAGLMLTLNTVACALVGPLHGIWSSLFPHRRFLLAIIGVSVELLMWIIILFKPVPPATMIIFGAAIILGMAAPCANIGFDTVREKIAPQLLGTASGMANMGGFLATLLAAQIYGILLDVVHQGNGAYVWTDFRQAFWGIFAVWLMGVAGMYLFRPRSLASKDG